MEGVADPLPSEDHDPALLSDVLEALAEGIDELREVGHNVIFASLALRGFGAVPRLVTATRVRGVARCVKAFSLWPAEGEIILGNLQREDNYRSRWSGTWDRGN